MHANHRYEEVIPIILAALPQSACSAEYRDHFDKISVRLFKPDGTILCTTEDMPLRLLSKRQVLGSRIEHWKLLLKGANAKSSARSPRTEA